jgi:hypothetical protein
MLRCEPSIWLNDLDRRSLMRRAASMGDRSCRVGPGNFTPSLNI